MSCNFYLYLDSVTFPIEAWEEILEPLDPGPPALRHEPSYFDHEWCCGGEGANVWVTARALTATSPSSGAPAWARWEIALDFHASVFGEVYDAHRIILRALQWLPAKVPGVRVGALDGQAAALVLDETVGAWAEHAGGWLLPDAVDELVQRTREGC